MEIKWSQFCFISTVEFSILVRWHLLKQPAGDMEPIHMIYNGFFFLWLHLTTNASKFSCCRAFPNCSKLISQSILCNNIYISRPQQPHRLIALGNALGNKNLPGGYKISRSRLAKEEIENYQISWFSRFLAWYVTRTTSNEGKAWIYWLRFFKILLRPD